MLSKLNTKILSILSVALTLSLLFSAIAAADSSDDYGFGGFDYDQGGFDYDYGGSDYGFGGFDYDYGGFDYDQGGFDYGFGGFDYDPQYPEPQDDTGDSDFFPTEPPYEPDTEPPYDNPDEDLPIPDDQPPYIPPDDGPGPGPVDRPARWYALQNQSIPQGSPYNTVVYQSIFAMCFDPDSRIVMKILSDFVDFNLAFSGLDLVIRDLNPVYTGTNKIELSCNGVNNHFYLTIYPIDKPKPGPSDEDEGGAAGIHISKIRILSDSDTVRPGEQIGIKLSISNNGNSRLEDVKLTASIQELGIRRAIGPFDLKAGNEITKTVYLDIPEYAYPGWYDIRLTLRDSGNQEKRIVYREIFIGEQ